MTGGNGCLPGRELELEQQPGGGMEVRESTENEWMAGGSLGVVGDITDVYGYVLPLE